MNKREDSYDGGLSERQKERMRRAEERGVVYVPPSSSIRANQRNQWAMA